MEVIQLLLQGEQLTVAIYELNWYLLMCSEQRKVLLVLMASQNPTVITCGQFCTANLSAYLQVWYKIIVRWYKLFFMISDLQINLLVFYVTAELNMYFLYA